MINVLNKRINILIISILIFIFAIGIIDVNALELKEPDLREQAKTQSQKSATEKREAERQIEIKRAEAEIKAQKLYEAMEGDGTITIGGLELWNFGFDVFGTDEEAIFNILESATTQEEKDLISEEYEALYGRNLRSDLRDELNVSDYTRALAGLKEQTKKELSPTNIYGDDELGGKAKEIGKEEAIKLQPTQTIEQKKSSEFVALEQEFFDALGKDADKDLSAFFNGLFTLGIIIAGFLAVVMIAVGGIQYMSTDAVSGKGEGRERITYALLGLLLILFSYILLKTINPDILKFNLFKTTNNSGGTSTGGGGGIGGTGTGGTSSVPTDIRTDADKKYDTYLQRWIKEQPDGAERAREIEAWRNEFGPGITLSSRHELILFFEWKRY